MRHKAKNSSHSGSSSGKSGKGQRGASGKGKGRPSGGSSGSALDLADLPLSLPNLSLENHAQWVPRYHAGKEATARQQESQTDLSSLVLQRNESDGVTLEDMDTLQLELEAMLAATVAKKGTLRDELKILENADRYKGNKAGSSEQSGRRTDKSVSRNSSILACINFVNAFRVLPLLANDRPAQTRKKTMSSVSKPHPMVRELANPSQFPLCNYSSLG